MSLFGFAIKMSSAGDGSVESKDKTQSLFRQIAENQDRAETCMFC